MRCSLPDARLGRRVGRKPDVVVHGSGLLGTVDRRAGSAQPATKPTDTPIAPPLPGEQISFTPTARRKQPLTPGSAPPCVGMLKASKVCFTRALA